MNINIHDIAMWAEHIGDRLEKGDSITATEALVAAMVKIGLSEKIKQEAEETFENPAQVYKMLITQIGDYDDN